MTINIVRGLVDSLQARQNNQKIEENNNPSKIANNQVTQSNVIARNTVVTDAVVNNAKSVRSSSNDSEKVKDSKSARELAKTISDQVRGDSSSAKDAHQLSSDSGQALLV